ncbi:acyltransferase domain-containing protein [Nakamurella lactea]|uniref:acyltransferase domain-containing protein n=1 Tax=Nakamurella lactea TaxID=459515 RepID=UPI0003F9D384|nr:acyltransferase domain-containing protein [Nakamurella lactea]
MSDLPLPTGTDLAERLAELTVPYDAIAAALSVADRLDTDRREFLRAAASRVRDGMGAGLEDFDLPLPPAGTEFGRLGYLICYAALLPSIRDLHRRFGVPDRIGRATLADLGRQAYVFGKRYGTPGFDKQNWLTLHFTGRLYQLGRLQFERFSAGADVAASAGAAGLSVQQGDPVLFVHIPRFLGGLTPAACDASIRAARDFFAAHFPDERHPIAVCASWLLDPQLTGYLDERSNIVAFQRRFTLAGPPRVDDVSALEFTFDEPDRPLDELPRTSRLERAIADVLAAGGHWHSATGWFRWQHPGS